MISILNEGYKNQIFATNASGSKIKIKNKVFIDLSNCAGSLILGHNSLIFKKSLKKIINMNVSNFAMPNIYAYKLANLLKKILPHFKYFIFCNSGSEAIYKTLRIINSLNKKKKIISVQGSWHGSVNQFLFKAQKKKKLPISDGVNEKYSKNLIFIPYNDLINSKKILNKNKKKISAIFIEPIQGCLPNTFSKKYLQFLRSFCDQNNITLVFDEMISGIRTYEGSVSMKYKIKPDIITLGKCIGGGMPIGVIGLSSKIKKKINNKKIFFGGTFSGNSISCLIGCDLLEYLLKYKNKIINSVNEKAEYIQNSVNKYLEKNKIKAKIYRFDSMFRIIFSNQDIKNRVQRDFLEKNNGNILKFYKFVDKNKIFIPSSGLCFTSYKTTRSDCKKIIKTFKTGLKKFF